ncbi:hypothetical protein ABEY43_06835 [Priestia megaterium]
MNIIFSDKNLTNEQKVYMKNMIESETEKFNLKLDRLEKLILTEDYVEELKTEWSLIEQDENESIEGLAKESVAMKIVDKEGKSLVFISRPCWEGLISGKEDFKDYCIHVINHELVHVHDHTIKYYHIYPEPKEDIRVSEDNLKFILRLKADRVWSEYIAERLSAPTVTDKVIWRTAGDLESRLGKMSSLDDILASFAMLLGIQHGLGDDCNYEIDNYVREVVEDGWLLQTWDCVKVELPRLFNKYPNWESIEELDTIGEIILETWKRFGLI